MRLSPLQFSSVPRGHAWPLSREAEPPAEKEDSVAWHPARLLSVSG